MPLEMAADLVKHGSGIEDNETARIVRVGSFLGTYFVDNPGPPCLGRRLNFPLAPKRSFFYICSLSARHVGIRG